MRIGISATGRASGKLNSASDAGGGVGREGDEHSSGVSRLEDRIRFAQDELMVPYSAL